MFVSPRCHKNHNYVPSQQGAELCVLSLLAPMSLETDQTPLAPRRFSFFLKRKDKSTKPQGFLHSANAFAMSKNFAG